MSEEFLKKIFNPFERSRDSDVEKIAGTGLGMTITKNIVDMMNGDIRIESSPGKGSVFTVTFRLLKNEEKTLRTPDRLVSSEGSVPVRDKAGCCRGKRLLLAEDNELNREIAVEMLKCTEMEIDTACDGEEAVRMFADSPEGYYDIILMDIQMPKLDGYEASREIRGMDRTDAGRIPIVAMTANAFAEDVREALRAGMNAHVSKPIEVDRLLATLEDLLV